MVEELCSAQEIEYKAFVRRYEDQTQILYVVATCMYKSYGSYTEVYFESEEGTWGGWKLKQRAPDGMPMLNSYHVAGGVLRTAIPEEPIPTEIEILDAHGKRLIAVEAW